MPPVIYLDDHLAPDIDDMIERVTAAARRQDDQEGGTREQR